MTGGSARSYLIFLALFGVLLATAIINPALPFLLLLHTLALWVVWCCDRAVGG